MKKVIFYHAGCPVCVSAEKELLSLVDSSVTVEVIHLGEQREKLAKAEQQGVKSVPALLLENGNVLHINFGAGIEDLKN